MQVKRVSLVGTLPPIKSISDYCLELTQALLEQVDVEFVNFKHIYAEVLYKGGGTKETDPLFKRPKSPRLAVKDLLTWYNPLSWLYAGLSTRGELVHIQWWTSFLFPVFFSIAVTTKLRGKKLVCTVHNVHGHETGWRDRILNKTILTLPDLFLVHTDRNKQQLHDTFGIPLDSIRVVPHGIFEFYRDEELTQAEAKRRLSIPPNAKVLLSFGHVRPYKGIEDLVAAFKIARQTVPDLFLVIAGKAWNEQLKSELEQQLSDTPSSLLHLDYVASSQIKEYFFAADIVVLAYREFAAQSGPGNIALAFEKPLIVADVGGLPELVGCPEAVFEPGNVPALAKAIERCIGDSGLLARMVADSVRLRERFSWRRVARDTVAAYQELLDSRP
ncbi:MAG TPA: glycosyltransferase family 4 protein [Polyangiaceae bacterium]|nr:glycosyltransferase family 4 protein [Polyangiaceae bacterium]